MKYSYLPKSKKSRDFVILGSKTGFVLMIFCAAALAIISGIAIINLIRKLIVKEIA